MGGAISTTQPCLLLQEPRKRFFQNTKLMPMLLGVSKTGVMRVDPKTKEVLDSWDYRIIRNWAYTSKTFLLVRAEAHGKGRGCGVCDSCGMHRRDALHVCR